MPVPNSNFPVALFPFKIETRFVSDELWIRAFPDVAFLQSHNPQLTKEELAEAKAFKAITIIQGTSIVDQQKAFWERLVEKYGIYRAMWVVHISEEELALQAQKSNSAGNNTLEETPTFYFKWLPKNLFFYLYTPGNRTPAYTGRGALINVERLTILEEDKQDNWIQNFEEAVKIGMGIKINLSNRETSFEKIIVCGIHHNNTPTDAAKGLTNLFRNHQYTEGFSFLKYGTATNNTDKTSSGYSARDEYNATDSFEYAVKGLSLDSEKETAGKILAKRLGIEVADFKHTQQADLKESSLNELFQKASWFALGAQPLFMLFGDKISNETHEEIWEYYTRFVKAKGPYPSLKIGNQPYGILPIMNRQKALLSDNEGEGEAIRNSPLLFDKLRVLLARMGNRWLEMATNVIEGISIVPNLDSPVDTYNEILRILSMQEYSSSYQIRALEYNYFQKNLNALIRQLPINAPLSAVMEHLSFSSPLKKDAQQAQKNIELLEKITGALPDLQDQLLRSPLLNLKAAATNFIGFQAEKSVLTDREGNILKDKEGKEIVQEPADIFSFHEENLANFQDFINKLKSGETTNLLDFQYKGALSLFTDLLLRSYTNASQLYYRTICFTPTTEDLIGHGDWNIGNILKTGEVKKGEIILEIKSKGRPPIVPSKTILITAPFDGKIEKIIKQTGEAIEPSMALFVLKNETKYQHIKNQFIELGQQIIDHCNSITDLNARKEAQKEAMREAIDLNSYRLDAWITSLATKRIDDMRSRNGFEKGIYFGAYGWVENLQKDRENTVNKNDLLDKSKKSEGGIIHTPTPAQAVASALFKNSFLSYKDEPGNPFALNLSSDRLQKSKFILEGIRQGQQLEALLGYQLERYLHEDAAELHSVIYTLREAFPLEVNITEQGSGQATAKGFTQMSVINGLKIIEAKNENLAFLRTQLNGSFNKVTAYIEKLEDTLDASLDALFYEAGYQVTQGNLSQAAAALDATKGEIEPPEIASIKTRIPGVGIAHKFILLFPHSTQIYPIENCRALAEPVLENWLQGQIGDLNQISCQVELINSDDDSLVETINVRLGELNIGYLDFLYLSEDPVQEGASELEWRIWTKVLEEKGALSPNIKYKITSDPPTNGQSLATALEVARYAYALLSKCRFLKTDDLSKEETIISEDLDALEAIKRNQLQRIVDHLRQITTVDVSQKNTQLFLSKLDFDFAKLALLSNEQIDLVKLKAAIHQKIQLVDTLLTKFDAQTSFDTAFDYLLQTAKALFGQHFILLPPTIPSDNFIQTIQSNQQELLVGNKSANTNGQVWGQERIDNWVQGLAQVKENSEIFEDWRMVSKMWKQQINSPQNESYQVVQEPTLLQYPWVALSKMEIDELLSTKYTTSTIYKNPNTEEAYPLADGTYYPDACESTVLYAPTNLNYGRAGAKTPVYGMMIEEFSEHIPNEKVETGLSFHYNAPNNEAPQAILLAVHPQAMHESGSTFEWLAEDLRDTLYDTMDLYKIRMVDVEAIQEYGFVLPLTYWFNVPSS